MNRKASYVFAPFVKVKLSNKPFYRSNLCAVVVFAVKSEGYHFLVKTADRFKGIFVVSVYYKAVCCF